MRFIIAMVVIIFCASLIANGLSRESEVELRMHSAEIQLALNEQQRDILKRLESMGDDTVSRFTEDWHNAFPDATAASLQELTIIEQKITADPGIAESFTLASKQKKMDELNSAFTPLFGGDVKVQKPGL